MSRGRKGFTLVEIIVVLVILAILAAIAIPSFSGYFDKLREKQAIRECESCVLAMNVMIKSSYTTASPILELRSELYASALSKGGLKGAVSVASLSGSPSDGDVMIGSLTYIAESGIVVVYTGGDYIVQ